jgi:hypothetical protein
MTRSTLRRASAAAVTVLTLASLAACGGDDDGGDDPGSSESSPTTESNDDPEGSEGTEDTGESEDPEDDPDDEEAGEEIDPSEFIDVFLDSMDRATTATFEMAFDGAAGVAGTGSADFSTDPLTMKLIITDPASGKDQTLIMVDGSMYLGLSPERFVEYDLSDPNGPFGTDLAEQFDPTAMAEIFEEGITGSAYLGEEDVEGESMEHYRATVDAAALLDEADLPSPPSGDAAEEVTFDMWFDDENMLRRQVVGYGETAGSVDQTFDDWGEPVDIKAPPKSQITKLPSS